MMPPPLRDGAVSEHSCPSRPCPLAYGLGLALRRPDTLVRVVRPSVNWIGSMALAVGPDVDPTKLHSDQRCGNATSACPLRRPPSESPGGSHRGGLKSRFHLLP